MGVGRQGETYSQTSGARHWGRRIPRPMIPNPFTTMNRTRIEVHGLPDDDAAARLEKMLTGKTGVPRANIDPALEIAEVSYDGDLVQPTDILNWIRGAGYEARFAGRPVD